MKQDDIATLYVSQKDGCDLNNGSEPGSALASIESALLLLSEARTKGAKQPIFIRITDEEYTINKPILIDESISALTIEPYTKTRISGGFRIDGFKPDTFNGHNCLSATLEDVKSGKLWFTDLYVNGVAANFTSYPKEGFLYAKSVENNGKKLYDHSKWFIAEDADLSAILSFRNFDDCFISYNHWWIDEHTPIESYDAESGKIVFAYPSRFTITSESETAKLRYKLENVAEAFENPGEWYLDRPTGKVYYIPRNGETADNIEVYAPLTDKLFVLKGTKDKKVCGVHIRGFEFNCTKGDYKSQYVELDSASDTYAFDENFEGYASDIQSVCWAHGSIEMHYAHSCSIEDCKLINMGVHAINIGHGCSNIRITNNEIREIGAGGIKIDGGVAEDAEYTHTHNVCVKNNLITRCGNRYFAGCGILLKQAYECEIAHNEISYLYYTGISCGWTWRYEPSVNKDNLIEKNHIHHIGQGKLSDMGGIYLLSEQPGTIVRGNLVHDVISKHYGGWGIYPDEGSSYLLIENNVCYNTTSNSVHNHYGKHNTFKNNIFVHAGKAPFDIGKGETTHVSDYVTCNILVANNKPYFSIGRVLDENENPYPEIVSVNFVANKNLLWDYSNCAQKYLSYGYEENTVYYTTAQAQNEIRFDTDSIVADPMFEDYENYNFTLKPDSPAFKLGFKPIDMSDVGRIEK